MPATNSTGEYLEISLESEEPELIAVATQGRDGGSEWVTSFAVLYSLDTESFRIAEPRDDTGSGLFSGNDDASTLVLRHLDVPIRSATPPCLPLF